MVVLHGISGREFLYCRMKSNLRICRIVGCIKLYSVSLHCQFKSGFKSYGHEIIHNDNNVSLLLLVRRPIKDAQRAILLSLSVSACQRLTVQNRMTHLSCLCLVLVNYSDLAVPDCILIIWFNKYAMNRVDLLYFCFFFLNLLM